MIVSFNAGSSSLKFAAFGSSGPGSLDVLASGVVTRIHDPEPVAEFSLADEEPETRFLGEPGQGLAARAVLDWLDGCFPAARLHGIGHRVVHGGTLSCHARIDDATEAAIDAAAGLAPVHNPPAIEVIRQVRSHVGAETPMAAVLDTAFFAGLDARAKYFAIPWELSRRHGIRRIGFHGIAHQSMLASAARMLGRSAAELSLITLQLGNGCSAALIHHGRALDTTMGMTPLDGLMMGTRSGSVDPALVAFLVARESMTASAVTDLLNSESGLLGLSGISSDMRDVMSAAVAGNARASLAVEMFAYRVRKQIGAFLAANGPVDAVVFGGGIGERSPDIRRMVMGGLGYLGLAIDDEANLRCRGGSGDISASGAMVRVLVAEVDELRTIAEVTRTLVS